MAKNKRSIDPSIIAALIGVVGTIIVTLITVYANRPAPQPTPFPTWTIPATSTIANTPVPTDTVPAGDPTSTPVPDTPTPEATSTPLPPAIGEDWVNNCISALWTPYPPLETTQTNGCLSQPIHSLFATDGRLSFVINDRFENTEQHGIFAPIPANGTANIDVFLTTLQDSEVWLGVFSQPDITSQGMIIVIPAGDVKNRLLVQKTMPGQVEYFRTQSFPQNSAIYNVEFQLASGSVTTRIMRDTIVDPLPINSSQPWLFVGYQVKKGNNRIQATFLNLAIQEP